MLIVLASNRLQHPCQSTNCCPVGLFRLDRCTSLLYLALHDHGGGYLYRAVHQLTEQHLPDRCPLCLVIHNVMLEDAIASILALVLLVQPVRLILLVYPELPLPLLSPLPRPPLPGFLSGSLGPLVEPSVLFCLSALPLHWQTTEPSKSRHSLVKVLRLMVPVLVCLWIPLKLQPEHGDLGHNVLKPL